MGWGGQFILALAVVCSVYLLGSMLYMGRLEKLDFNDVRTFTPHGAQFVAMAGLVHDGFTFTLGAYAAARASPGLAAPLLIAETKEEEGARKTREASVAALREKQKPAKVGKSRTIIHEAAMVGDVAKLKKHLAAELADGGGKKSSGKDKGSNRSSGSKILDQGDQRGYTPYHHACAGGHEECVKLLVAAGCDTLRTSDTGMTGWQLASKSGKVGLVAMLRKLAAKGKHARLTLEFAVEEATEAEEHAANQLGQAEAPSRG
eukprot:COSAG02_NODE_446_length_22141_cov_17.963842_6_plen_261_part_00